MRGLTSLCGLIAGAFSPKMSNPTALMAHSRVSKTRVRCRYITSCTPSGAFIISSTQCAASARLLVSRTAVRWILTDRRSLRRPCVDCCCRYRSLRHFLMDLFHLSYFSPKFSHQLAHIGILRRQVGAGLPRGEDPLHCGYMRLLVVVTVSIFIICYRSIRCSTVVNRFDSYS